MKGFIVGVLILVGYSFLVDQQLKSNDAGKGRADHGRYIAEQVAMCIQCHTPREGNGGLISSRAFGGAPIPFAKPGMFNAWAEYAPRIAGLPQYNDEQIIRLLTTGIGREGNPLRLPMPQFRMSRQDAEDVSMFLRSLD